jgi:serine protease AprX
MLNGDYLHAAGYTGEGLTCAIIDAGFTNVDELSVFERLFDNGQILGTFDFVEGDADVFGHNAHGTHVFTIMGANEPGVYVGAAPDANYWLFRTEDAASETLLEEYNWLAAAEFADSVGVDLINSSLGYSTFDNTSNNHSYADMDGNTTVISKAADMAASKGILVVVSAGNQGNKPWHYVTAPADADSVLSVGAVDSLKQYVSFSSVGPSADGQIKPNIVGQGHNTAYVGTDGNLKHGNGTSFSAPLIAGLATCLWQAYPEKNNMDIIGLIESSASQAQNPDNHLGYGIPNFYTAMLQGNNDPILNFDEEMVAFVYPNPFANDASIYYYANLNEIITLQLYDYTGRLLASYATEVRVDTPYKFDFPNWVKYPKGAYLIKIISDQQQKNLKSIKVGN